ncbi:hypothetical protein PENFLA_c051G01848 [Penicillium flavigenum]|uniref:Uncharacterized protein n=1 Tax=Penicillium flavigenum TaxID=254877 RepID=A0A1V6SHK9_9EURO|nr:hypothetical protein PENFLA_c051G01848 [Penicillium flavigenum]
MTLNEDSDLNPRFFAPRHNLPQPSHELIREAVDGVTDREAFQDGMSRAYHSERQWSSYALQSCWASLKRGSDNPWRSMPICEYNPFKSLYKYDKPDFGVFGIRDVAGPAFPNMKAVTWNSLETESSKLRKVRLLHHDVAPIMIVSLIGKRGRLLESYFEGESLVLRCSDLYNFSDEETTSRAYKAFAEWYLGAPAGNTV